MNLLQKYLFIPLDIFTKNLQNNGINNKLDAWLAFLSNDDPEVIIKIIETYPAFAKMYAHVYEICQNIERVMEMFSKELLELDRNTVQLMIDEMQAEINQQQAELSLTRQQLDAKDQQLSQSEEAYQKALRRIAELEHQIQSN